MRRFHVRLIVASLAAALAGCGGGGNSTAPSTPRATTDAGAFVLTIPAAATAAASRAPKYVSASAVSLSITVNGGAATVADISVTSPNCTTTQTGRSCTVPLTAPSGRDTFTITQYDAANATGHVLGSGTAVLNVVAGTPFQLQAVLNGAVASLQLALGTLPPAGVGGTDTLTVEAYDADGNLIIGPGNYVVPITLTLVDPSGQTSLSTTSVTSPSQAAVTINYAGGFGVSATITATASGATQAQTTFAPTGGGLNLYIAQLGASSVTATPINASGNAAPVRTIAGGNTQISQDYGVAVDANDQVYVSDLRNPVITVYSAGSFGNVAPLRTITGSNTGLSGPLGLAIDAAGELIVSNFFNDTITVYAAGANGNATPVRTIAGGNTNLAEPYGITLDASGNLYVVDNVSQYGGTDEVTVYAPGANGNVTPTRTITGNATGMSGAVYDAVDAAGKLYVVNSSANSVTVYAPGANGNAAPVATIAGSNTGFNTPYAIALDSTGTIYVSVGGTNSVNIFPAGSNGNVTPTRTIVGPATGMSAPLQMQIAP
jgi:hypothetical protein